MGALFAITNLINLSTLASVTTEDTLYVKENLYNQRPSKPFRFTAKAAQDIRVNLGAAHKVTLAGVFNHNLLQAATVTLQANAADAWGGPSYTSAMTWREYDEGKVLSQTYQWWRLYVSDAGNPAMPEIGEFFLGEYERFTNAHLQPGRAVSPVFFRSKSMTPMGQIWSKGYSEGDEMELTFKNTNQVGNRDDIRDFLGRVHDNDGRFVIVPDENLTHIYYVFLDTDSGFASSILRGTVDELNEWRFKVVTLTRGVSLL